MSAPFATFISSDVELGPGDVMAPVSPKLHLASPLAAGFIAVADIRLSLEQLFLHIFDEVVTNLRCKEQPSSRRGNKKFLTSCLNYLIRKRCCFARPTGVR
ncbi:hypothetical protein MPTK1_2g06700 [Marchantia polymorpha subsp. ruderalis]|uniref:Uncharacterized protein n=1 Tax=Marchantia polymorpha TaxID=3197 RepID=A0A2R6XDX9_MARPO|nr:hypothetical protein MARPO_0021s0123 [Marchantia polymorpha]BBN01343.1 hypothetical protein Mp_2g06700 [Marchantia polymorpha subsp. ruderalis]|eukprot:PTQ44269.1 hypothetical protein MARPO_0021s0123 [Marchantia polymorpha]